MAASPVPDFAAVAMCDVTVSLPQREPSRRVSLSAAARTRRMTFAQRLTYRDVSRQPRPGLVPVRNVRGPLACHPCGPVSRSGDRGPPVTSTAVRRPRATAAHSVALVRPEQPPGITAKGRGRGRGCVAPRRGLQPSDLAERATVDGPFGSGDLFREWG